MTWLTKKTINKFKNFKNEIADSRKPKRNINLSKKLVFTALAVVAFSGAAMANTGEVKVINSLAFDNDCSVETIKKMDALDPNNELSPTEAGTIYQILYDNCIGKSMTKSLTQA